jgi:ATP-binding cassette, subfamily B, bacterial
MSATQPGQAAALSGGVRLTLTHLRRTLGLVWRTSRPLTVALGALTLLGALVPVGIAWVGKQIIDGVVAQNGPRTLRAVLLELGLVVLVASVQRGLSLVRALLGARLGIDLNVAILAKALTLELSHFEDSEFYDKLTRARREASSRPVAMATDAFHLVENLLSLGGYAALLVGYSPLAVVGLLLATVPATLAEWRFSKQSFRLRNWRSPESRRLLYLEYVLANDEHAKEVKLFGIGPILLGRYRTLAETLYDEDRRLTWRRSVATHLLSLLATGAFYGAYVGMALRAVEGRITLGELSLYILAFRQGQSLFQSALGAVGSLYEHNLYLANLFTYLDLPTGVARPRPVTVGQALPEAAAAGATPFAGVRFEGVGFRYPGRDEWALRDIDLVVPRGESLALVGENGAGKTTLIKLLTRLYEPTEGRILLDGRLLSDWPIDALRARIGVVFQDFNQYQLRVRENVGFGSVDHLDDDTRLVRAVERGGAEEVVSALKGGLDAPLGRWFQEGSELSGGQWQKIALARAFVREEADILVLDEPTAALDAEAEHAVFERFRELARERTTVTISHRFPTVRMASRIVVLDHGRIIESGTHDALIAQGGQYARMFSLQAEGYR